MTPKKSVIVLIIAVALLMSGGIIGAFIFSSPTTVGSGVDHFNDNLAVGDNYTVSVTSDATETGATYMSRSEFFEWLYTVRGLLDVKHTKVIVVNNVSVTCACYYEETEDGKNIYFVNPDADPEYARVYGYETYVGDYLVDSRILVSTNFSLDKKLAEQSMESDPKPIMSFITSSTVNNMICPAVSIILECTVTQTVGNYSEAQLKWAVTENTESHDSESATTTVRDYISDSSGSTVFTTDGKILTKEQYLMTVNYQEFLTYIKSTGAIFSRGIPVSKTISTVYGERDVTEEVITIFGAFQAKYTIDFGSDYVIYSFTEEKIGQTGTTVTTVTSCSFMYEGTKEVYGSQLNLTLDSFTVAVIVIAIAAAAAAIIGYFAFRMIYHKVEKI